MFERALQLNPEDVHISSALAIVYEFQQKYEQAVNLYKKLSVLDPGNPNILEQLMRLHVYLDQAEPALEYARQLRDLDPQNRESSLTNRNSSI